MEAVAREFAVYVSESPRAARGGRDRRSMRSPTPRTGRHRGLPPADRARPQAGAARGRGRREAAHAAARDADPGERVPGHRARHRRPGARQHRAASAQDRSCASACECCATSWARRPTRRASRASTSSCWQEKELPEAAAAALTKEIKRLGDLPPFSAEVAVATDLPGPRAGAALGQACPAPSCPTWRRWRGCWTRRTTGWTTSRTASSSTWRSPACGRARRPTRCSASSGRPAWARPRSPWPSRRVWTGRCSASAWAACATRPRSGGTAAPTWAPCPGASSTR